MWHCCLLRKYSKLNKKKKHVLCMRLVVQALSNSTHYFTSLGAIFFTAIGKKNISPSYICKLFFFSSFSKLGDCAGIRIPSPWTPLMRDTTA